MIFLLDPGCIVLIFVWNFRKNTIMDKLLKVVFGTLIFGFCLISCGDSKKENATQESDVSEEQVDDNQKEEAKDHGYEMAMAAYQCPMKCEGDKTYKEEGSCPLCKMDLKKVEALPEEAKSKEKGSE